MINIGAHISIAKGYLKAAQDAVSIGANTFQFFTRNPRGGAAKAFDQQDVDALDVILRQNNFAPLLAHAPYTINMASGESNIRRIAAELTAADLSALDRIPCHLYNIHPGTRKELSVDEGAQNVAEIINAVLKPSHTSYLLLETMSGKGSELGATFEELREIIDRIDLKDKIGVCMDTCHLYCAGYDIVGDIDGVMCAFDKTIGLDRLMAVHLNDSMNPFRSRKDRHAPIGQGSIGLNGIMAFVNHPAICRLPMLLETPNELEGFKSEIEMIKSRYLH